MVGRDEIKVRFNYNEQSNADKVKLKVLCFDIMVLANLIDENMPDGREKSLALTKLEESMFYVYAGLERSKQD